MVRAEDISTMIRSVRDISKECSLQDANLTKQGSRFHSSVFQTIFSELKSDLDRKLTVM